MSANYENRNSNESHLTGGLTPEEAEEMADFDTSKLEDGEYQPSDIPALGTYIQEYQNQEQHASLPADSLESYVSQLLERPGDVVPEWSSPPQTCFEDLDNCFREKRDEYVIRTVYSAQDSLDQESIDKALKEIIVDQSNYKPRGTSDGGNLGLIIGQYLPEIQEMAQNDNILQEAYSTIAEETEASAAAAANVPVSQLLEAVQQNIFTGGSELSSDKAATRLRSMEGGGKCDGIEEGHDTSLLANYPTRNNTLITLEDEIVGSLKYEGDNSLVALKDVAYSGKQVLQKGMAYRVSHRMLGVLETERMNDQQEEYADWEILPVERLELRPLRFAGGFQFTPQQFRERIDEKMNEIETSL